MHNVIFVAGVYGVGKSTLCNKLSSAAGIPAFSAGDLISDINGETYGRNKVVKDAKNNQDILISAVDAKLEECPHFLLAGHFCIVDKDNEVELLPEYVFSKLHLSQIILLEANVLRIAENINGRDHRKYPAQTRERLIACERSQAQRVAKELKIPLTIHNMQFNYSDEEALANLLLGGHENESTPGYKHRNT
jgi:adenylate kinase